MKKNTRHFYMALLLFVMVVPLWTGVSQGVVKTSDMQVNIQNNQKVLAKVSTLRIPFVSNKGQVAKEVGFYAKTFGGTIYVTQKGELVYSLIHKEKDNAVGKKVERRKNHKIKVCVLKERLLQANNIILQGQEKATTKVNYLIGGKANWKTNIPSFNRVSFGHVYDHIDLALRAHANNVEKIFTVHPKGKVEDIRLVTDGAVSMKLNPTGELEIDTGSGTISFSVPIAFQEIEGKRQNVQVAYAIKDNTYGFTVGQYNHQFPLVIDPTLVYSTYLGGTDEDDGQSIKVDSSGNAYVTGYTMSTDFPTTLGAYDSSPNDVFVTKLNPTGDSLVYSTYLGGSSYESSYGIGVDSTGNAYVTGLTYSDDFPTTTGAYQTTHAPQGELGNTDAFITKLNSNGDDLVYSTYLGDIDRDEGFSIEVDGVGNAYVTGTTMSGGFPTAGSPFQSSYGVGGDAFVTKLNPTGTDLTYSTFLGGSNEDWGYHISLDGSGNAYIIGSTTSSNFPTAGSPFQATAPSPDFLVYDAFVTKLDPTGAGVYSTYFGGSLDDHGRGLAVDSSGNAYITGTTASADPGDFPITGSAYQASHEGDFDAFVSKLNDTGSSVSYSTFLGGATTDAGNSIWIDSSGNACVFGTTLSTNFPTTSDAYQNSLATSDFNDAFLTKLDATGSALLYSTYFGGRDDDHGHVHALDSSGNAYVIGTTYSDDFPTASFQTTLGGFSDAFVAKFELGGAGSSSESATLPQVAPGTQLSDFAMISFVHSPVDPKATSVINITYNTKYYRIGTYDPTTGGYIEYGSSLTIKPGRAYWVLARDGLTINYNGIPVSLGTDFDFGLGYNASTGNGWNMVACPNAANYLWSNVQVVFDGVAYNMSDPTVDTLIDTRLWRWASGSYYSDTTSMEKYKGYWVKAKQANISLRFPVSAQASLSNSTIMVASLLYKGKRWLNKWILAPKAAIADTGDSPPMPMNALSGDTKGGGCFIATAAYGSAMAPHVSVLREFRDRFMLTNYIGKALVDLYYKTSPGVANVIAKHANLKTVVRISLLPVVGLSWMALKLGPALMIILMLLMGTGLVGLTAYRRLK